LSRPRLIPRGRRRWLRQVSCFTLLARRFEVTIALRTPIKLNSHAYVLDIHPVYGVYGVDFTRSSKSQPKAMAVKIEFCPDERLVVDALPVRGELHDANPVYGVPDVDNPMQPFLRCEVVKPKNDPDIPGVWAGIGGSGYRRHTAGHLSHRIPGDW
jgi:hypothetical protein